MNRTEIENLVTVCFSHCPFCLAETSMRFEWGHSIPKQMTCSNCGSKWELLFGLNDSWKFLGAKLLETGSTRKGAHMKGKMFDKQFWNDAVTRGMSVKPSPSAREGPSAVAEKTIVIREVVKIRCPYCGALYDEVKDKCPHCAGKR